MGYRGVGTKVPLAEKSRAMEAGVGQNSRAVEAGVGRNSSLPWPADGNCLAGFCPAFVQCCFTSTETVHWTIWDGGALP